MRKRNETLCLWLGSAELARRKGASWRTQVRAIFRFYLCSFPFFVFYSHLYSIFSFLSIKKDDRNFLRSSSFFVEIYLASSSAIFLCCAAICSLCSIISAFCAFISSCIRPTKAYNSDTVVLLSSMRSPPLPTLTDTPTL